MKYYNKRQNTLSIHYGASPKSVFHLMKSSTWLSSFHVTWESGSTKLWFNVMTLSCHNNECLFSYNLMKSSMWLSSFHVTWGSGSTKLWFDVMTLSCHNNECLFRYMHLLINFSLLLIKLFPLYELISSFSFTHKIALYFTYIIWWTFYYDAPSYFWNKVVSFNFPMFFQQFCVICILFMGKRFSWL